MPHNLDTGLNEPDIVSDPMFDVYAILIFLACIGACYTLILGIGRLR